jgi:hypothetical protein
MPSLVAPKPEELRTRKRRVSDEGKNFTRRAGRG